MKRALDFAMQLNAIENEEARDKASFNPDHLVRLTWADLIRSRDKAIVESCKEGGNQND